MYELPVREADSNTREQKEQKEKATRNPRQVWREERLTIFASSPSLHFFAGSKIPILRHQAIVAGAFWVVSKPFQIGRFLNHFD